MKISVFSVLICANLCLAQNQPKRPPPPDDILKHEVWGAVSKDGKDFEELDGPFFKKASVPDVLELSQDGKAGKKGTLLLYFVDFGEFKGAGSEGLTVASSTDGKKWEKKGSVTIKGKKNKGAAVDPSVVETDDGKIRLYFFGSETTCGDPARAEGDHVFYSAISDDGLNFELEKGERFKLPQITDPEVFRVGKEWYMLISRGPETLMAKSEDGLMFTHEKDFRLRIGGVPGGIELDDGRVRIFACGRDGINSAIYDPATGKTTEEKGGRVPRGSAKIIADPSAIKRADGTYFMIFKKVP